MKSNDLQGIHVNAKDYRYVIFDSDHCRLLRVYSDVFDTSRFEVMFDWTSKYIERIDNPLFISVLIEYAVSYGWDAQDPMSRYTFSNRDRALECLLSMSGMMEKAV